LKNKKSSNRALYSLTSQDHVIGFGDNPIPSFMIFQCGIEKEILYCTVYFRALEVARFFRINLEEIRLNICDILKDIPDISIIKLSILAFSAYNKPEQIPLEKCQLDVLSSLQIQDMYDSNPASIPELLDQKAEETTVVDITGLKEIKAWLDPARKDKWPSKLSDNVPKIISAIEKAINAANELCDLRLSNSHNEYVDKISKDYVEMIKKVAQEFRECL
jgi:hypothetical protein